MMTLVFPLALSDKPRIKKFVEGIRHFGPYNTERALIVPTPSVMMEPEMKKLVFDLAAIFGGTGENGRAIIKPLPNDPIGNWPHAPNVHFQFIVDYLANIHPQQPWMIVETDGTPTQSGWVTKIGQEHSIMGNPFMGAIEPSRLIQHFKTEKKEIIDGEHMVGGCGVYPPNYTKGVGKGGSPRVIWDFPDTKIPYDIRCQWDHTPCSPSRLMLHKPRTVNWKAADGESGKCYTVEDEAGKPDEFGNTQAGTVDLNGICFVHGCKDSSLISILMEAIPTENAAEPFAAPQGRQDAEDDGLPIAAREASQIEDVRPSGSNFAPLLANWKLKNPDLDEGIFWDQISSHMNRIEQDMLNPTPQLTEDTKPKVKVGEFKKILDIINSTEKKKVKIQKLSEDTGIPLNKLKAMSKELNSPFRVVAFGWVELRAKAMA